MADTRDTIQSQIPQHINEDYPRFVQFLKAYYEWLNAENNPYRELKNHMDYLAFEKSVDEYVEFMKDEYLHNLPDSVAVDKEMFIQWSKKFNLSRGSHESFRFLFSVLYGEENTSIYLPKDNILKTSDGRWVSGQSVMLVTYNAESSKLFQYQKIVQTRPIYKDIVETATAIVESVKTKYLGRFIVTELSISNIKGEFVQGYPIETETGALEYMISSVDVPAIENKGTKYQIGERLYLENADTHCVERDAKISNEFDTRVSSFYTKQDVSVSVNGTTLLDSEYDYDGRTIVSDMIMAGDIVRIEMPSYGGYIVVDQIDESRGVVTIDVLESPVMCDEVNSYNVIADGAGTGLVATANPGFIRKVKGYYVGTKGQLSSNMYIQDSYFYQDFSYAIRTEQDYRKYAEIVKEILHPAGQIMFGQISVVNVIELIIKYTDIPSINNLPIDTFVHKYGLGTNWVSVRRFKDDIDQSNHRLYPQGYFDSIDPLYFVGESGYQYESEYLAERFDNYDYPNLRGPMTRTNLMDQHLFIQQQYVQDPDSGDLYFETGYTSDITP
jgi:hypothetical protein